MAKPKSSRPPRKTPGISPNDIVIAVMGVTGVGKSTFIGLFSEDVAVGHHLESCTSQVSIYSCGAIDQQSDRNLFLVDTPGFDDTYKSDTDILREVANWLGEAYENEIKLTGIIYLHRIVDNRLGGAGMKNLRMFKKLCGEDGLKAVSLATTMWSTIDPMEGQRREQELMTNPEFWAGMIAKGSKVFRHDRDYESAIEIVKYLVSRKKPIVLEIQKQMVDQKMTLDQTGAGKEVEAEIERQRKRHEKELQELKKEMKEAIDTKDKEAQQDIRRLREEIAEKMKKDQEDRAKLQQNWENIRAEKERELNREKEERYRLMTKNAQELTEQRYKLEMMKTESQNKIEHQRVMFELEKQNSELEKQRAEAEKWKAEAEGGCLIM